MDTEDIDVAGLVGIDLEGANLWQLMESYLWQWCRQRLGRIASAEQWGKGSFRDGLREFGRTVAQSGAAPNWRDEPGTAAVLVEWIYVCEEELGL